MNLKNYISDTAVMSGRVLKRTLRSVDTIITVVAMPVMIMLASVYIYGGAMNLGAVSYVDYIVPGIILFCIGSGVAYAAVRLNDDVTKGIFERFHSMPIAKSSILGGHVLVSVAFNAVSCLAVLIVAFIMGFRPHADIACWLAAAAILVIFTVSMTWIAVASGLLAGSMETSGVFSYILLALIFTSSGFAPTDTMPAGLRAFAERQPMTSVIDSVRSLLVDGRFTGSIWAALAWCAVIWAVFQIIALRAYKGRMK